MTNYLPKLFLASAIFGGLAGTQLASAACSPIPPLTVANLQQRFLGSGQLAFQFDNDGTATAPLCLDLGATGYNANTGAFTNGQITSRCSWPNAQNFSTVSGTVTQVGASGLGISFSYVSVAPLTLPMRYSYSGAIMPVGGLCPPGNLFIAGTYTASIVAGYPPRLITFGPYPFSGKAIFAWYV